MRRLFGYRDARLLVAGETLSMFGDRAMFFALAIWAKSLTGSSAVAGLVFFAFTLPTLAAPLAGLLVDRVPRRRLMIAVDCTIGAIVLLLLFVHDEGDLWLLFLVTVLYGSAAAISGSARSALLTVLLPDDLLGEANAALQTAGEGLRLVAPLAGAGLFAAAGGGAVAIVDAATFGASALALTLIRTPEAVTEAPRQRLRRELAAGAAHVWRTLPLRQVVLASAVAFLVIGFSETLIFTVISKGLSRPPSFFGVLGAIQGVGAIAGGLTAPLVLRRIGDGRLVGAGVGLFGVGYALLVVPRLLPVAAGVALAGVGLSWGIVGFGTAIQRRTPGPLQGRVYSAAEMLVGTPQTISIALGAGLSTLFDYRALIIAMSAVMAACGAYLVSRTTYRPAPSERTADDGLVAPS